MTDNKYVNKAPRRSWNKDVESESDDEEMEVESNKEDMKVEADDEDIDIESDDLVIGGCSAIDNQNVEKSEETFPTHGRSESQTLPQSSLHRGRYTNGRQSSVTADQIFDTRYRSSRKMQSMVSLKELSAGEHPGIQTKQIEDKIAELTNQIKNLQETVKELQVKQRHTIANDRQSSSVDKQEINNSMPVLKLGVKDPTELSNGTTTSILSNEDAAKTDTAQGNTNDDTPTDIVCNIFENIPTDSNKADLENKTVNNGSDSEKSDVVGAYTDSLNAKTSFKPYQRTTTTQPPNLKRDTTDIRRNTSSIRNIDSNVKASHRDPSYWILLAQMEHTDGENQLKELDGTHTVICVDISSSTADGNAWNEASRFVNDYIEGLMHIQKEHGLHDEHVALVTFGHDTRVVERLTNDFSKIRNAFDGLSIGGPSPMYAGMLMASAAGLSPEKQIYRVNNHIVKTKIILISDMHPTDTCMYQGPDVADHKHLDETKNHIISKLQDIQNTGLIDIFFVPVGDFNQEFLDLMQAVSEGYELQFRQGCQFSRRLYLMNLAQGPLGLITPRGESRWSGSDKAQMSVDDKKQLDEIKAEGMNHMIRRLGGGVQHENELNDTDSGTLPPVGVRVKRGPDWIWNSQDNYGPGTVVGHSEDGKHVWVDWDKNEQTGMLRYGYSGNYDVLIVDEPRVVTDGKIAVGCTVKPGKDFPYASTIIKQHDRGIAIRLSKGNRTVNVKWNNKKKGEYKFASSQQDTAEVELATPTSTSVIPDFGAIAKEESTAKPTKKNKNKNW